MFLYSVGELKNIYLELYENPTQTTNRASEARVILKPYLTEIQISQTLKKLANHSSTVQLITVSGVDHEIYTGWEEQMGGLQGTFKSSMLMTLGSMKISHFSMGEFLLSYGDLSQQGMQQMQNNPKIGTTK